ncbi:hypothetical protein BCT94_05740 [Vibrio breoganii]|nr:hypothetical protein BCT94_05740 [Vibrio breoganii]
MVNLVIIAVMGWFANAHKLKRLLGIGLNAMRIQDVLWTSSKMGHPLKVFERKNKKALSVKY